MAEETLHNDLQREAEFLAAYDATIRAVNERFDVPGSTRSRLIRMAWSHGGTLSRNRRKQFEGKVQPELFDFIKAGLRAHPQRTEPSQH